MSPICGKALDGGFTAPGFDSTTIYDSDAESIRETRRHWLRPDGESLFKDDKNLTEMFDEAKSLPSSKWADTPPTRTNASDLGDDERSVAEEPLQRLRQNSTRPFTQRERMLALGYDYDSDSDVEASLDSDEIPEERALMLLNTLIVSGGSRSGNQVEQKVNMNTIAKLRREIRKRRRTGAAGRRVGRNPSTVDHQDDESRDETK
ncbi:hypothetical protein ESCO_005319 [Escovopsis weberi]|uniref:Uncharacterized protein n=1 Tax=Escovopsis weberi TaxID=150374 RepID=A0A0M9VUW9_ESCWE|nr:hypothetical protein ESCO_005319 [Escovopsis weberi]